MTAAECRSVLGSSSKFVLKSRFAICSGASFLQTWLSRGQPVGESMFNVMAVGTIAENTRQIQFTYHVTDQVTAGRNGAAGMQITLDGKIAQSWPSGVTYTSGGTALPATKTWAQFAAAGSVQTTVTAANGAGSNGSTESIFAVYQPSVKIKAPTPWTLGGSTGGDLFMLAPRWDKASYLANSTKGGAATFSYIGTLYYSKAVGAPEQAVALHIDKAYRTPGQTQPPSSTKKIPGQTTDEPLTRLYADTARRDRNRSVAVSNCRQYFGPNYADGGKECDEFPFASTYQGAAASEYDPHQLRNNFSVQALDGVQNGNAGNLLGQFYSKYRLLDGPDDGYLVQITD
ncbi:NucA/NucB deoxyribonuclease domain-containing protein [Streptomyces shenzhenensis]|uniref:NucA/NucB deoxyribonuclease domain-containing protein n=1 Tax=Streptomyces shenzhenensis TaxID=943815 RepID=UPI003807CCA2